MKITFTYDEYLRILELLNDNCDACTDEEVKEVSYFIKKFKNAETRSQASYNKIRHIHAADDRKQRAHDNEVRDSFAKALRESRKQTRTKGGLSSE